MARLLMFGGCGRQAQPAVDLLLDRGVFDAIILGDIDLELAQRLVSDRGDPKLSAVRLDAFDHRGMVDAMQDVDVVYNCSGPYHLLGLKVLRAAIEARRHYVDYCDDTEPTLDMLELDEEARQGGVTAIVGLGASPGCTNLLAKRAADELESVEEINMYWSIAPGEPEGPAVLDHMFHIMCGDVIQFLDGKETRVPALSGQEVEIEMPAPFGRLPTAYVGHPEPATLGRYIPGIRQVINKYAASASELGFYQGLRELGLMSNQPIDVKGQAVAPRDVLISLMLAAPHPEVPAEERRSVAVIDVKGSRDGAPARVRYAAAANMAPLTSIPGALGAIMLARGEIAETGVMPPEACVPPEAIIDPLQELGLVQLREQAL